MDAGGRSALSPEATTTSRGEKRAKRASRSAGSYGGEAEFACRDVDGSDSDQRVDVALSPSTSLRATGECDDVVVSRAVEQIIGERRARRDRLHHRALDDPFRQLRVFDLLADRDAESLRDEASHVVARRLDRDAGERDLGRAAIVPRGERQPENPRRDFGVFVEHFIELAHPEKQDGVLMSALDLTILLHQRRRGRHRHISSGPIRTTNEFDLAIASIFFNAA